VIKVQTSPIVGLKSGCIFLGEDYVGVVLGTEGIFGVQKDDRPQKGDEPERKGSEATNIAQRKERREHKGKGAATRMNIVKISDIRIRTAD